jgi:tRNA(Ile)-lysidine synthase TilS/MesJ
MSYGECVCVCTLSLYDYMCVCVCVFDVNTVPLGGDGIEVNARQALKYVFRIHFRHNAISKIAQAFNRHTLSETPIFVTQIDLFVFKGSILLTETSYFPLT